MPDSNEENVDFNTVRNDELGEIIKRRREANVSGDEELEDGNSVQSDLVGLALSGGGVRSASFNLGFIQSLYEKGLLRHIDYMSTVSGGGYVGSSLSSLALHPETEFDWKSDARKEAASETNPPDESFDDPERPPPESPTAKKTPEALGDKTPEKKFPLSPREDGRQPPRVLDLIHGGHYLRRPLIFLNRYLVGVLLTNVVALSLVVCVAALAAWMFRYLDHTWTINWLYALGFQGDIARAFFPMCLFFVFWLVMWGISYWRKGSQAEGHAARWFMTLTIVSLLLAVAALLGTGDVSLTHLRENYGIEPPSETIRLLGGELKTYFVIALVIALIPYLRIKDLIRSGTRPRTAVESWVFGIASRALLYGIPLLVFGWLARENISHFNENRVANRYGQVINTQYDFVPLEFQDWSKTWQEIELQATELSESEENGRFAVSRRLWSEVDHDEVDKSREVLEKIGKFDRETSMVRRWLLFIGYSITRQPNPVTEQFNRREQYLQLRRSVCASLTQSVLVDPQFYKEFAYAAEAIEVELANLSDEQRELRLNRIKALIVEAQHLEKRIENASNGEQTFANWVKLRNDTLRRLDAATENKITETTVAMRKQLAGLMTLDEGKFANLEVEVKSINWQLLQNYMGERLATKSTVYAMVVLNADQTKRWNWFLWSFVFFLASACMVNMNSTSLHGFYRNMLSKMWITECPGIGRQIPLARLETAARGAPYHLIAATVHLLGRRRATDRSTTDSFIFSQSYCGSTRTGYVRTEDYMKGRFDLSNAMALSGAAVSPTQVHNPLLAVLLMLSNSRLGQWLPNPGHRVLVTGWFHRFVSWLPPVPLRLIVGAFQNAENRNYCFVSDGGHHENLALEPLLLRRCRLIIASDVTGDGEYEFQDFIRLLRRMRFEHGIRIVALDGQECDLGLESLTPERLRADFDSSHADLEKCTSRLAKSNRAKAHYFVVQILYPEDGPADSPRKGYLVFVKPNFTGDEAADLTRYQLENPAFPHDPTSDQFYDPQKFESYRQLGFHIGKTLCDEQFCTRSGGKKCGPLRKWTPDRVAEEPVDGNPDQTLPPEDESFGETADIESSTKNSNKRQPR